MIKCAFSFFFICRHEVLVSVWHFLERENECVLKDLSDLWIGTHSFSLSRAKRQELPCHHWKEKGKGKIEHIISFFSCARLIFPFLFFLYDDRWSFSWTSFHYPEIFHFPVLRLLVHRKMFWKISDEMKRIVQAVITFFL